MSDPTPSEILPDLDLRQDVALKELDELNRRIEGVLKELTSSGGAGATGVTGHGEQMLASEPSRITDGGRDVPTC